jgi:hypothetical protein
MSAAANMMPVFRRILVPTDFPGGRRVAIDYAAEFARKTQLIFRRS